jgi:4-hydroxymandelate synthase
MAADGLAYVELYTRDAEPAIEYLVAGLGFSRLAGSTDPERDSVLLGHGEVRLVVTSGPATHAFLDQHGDGIADIAFTCDDIVGTRRAALAAGARLSVNGGGELMITGPGGVSHTLLPGTGEGPHLPSDRRWTLQPAPSGGPAGRIRLLDHIAICLEGGSLAGAADFYSDALGLGRYSSEYVDTGGQGMDSIVVRSASGRVTFTLVAPDPDKKPGQLDTFLARNGGPGVQHLAFLVDDIVSAVQDLSARGVTFLTAPETYYQRLAERFPDLNGEIAQLRSTNVLADRDEWGYLLQLFSRSPYDRNTLFYELIQRRGARGFGSGNIRALYEAVEQDRVETP